MWSWTRLCAVSVFRALKCQDPAVDNLWLIILFHKLRFVCLFRKTTVCACGIETIWWYWLQNTCRICLFGKPTSTNAERKRSDHISELSIILLQQNAMRMASCGRLRSGNTTNQFLFRCTLENKVVTGTSNVCQMDTRIIRYLARLLTTYTS